MVTLKTSCPSFGKFRNTDKCFSEHHLNWLEKSGKLKIYCGFDPTADSLQLGNLVALSGLFRAQASGNNIIALVGQGTSSIGDPTGRKEARILSSPEVYALNAERLQQALLDMQKNFMEQFIPNFKQKVEPGNFKLLNNNDWLQKTNLLDFTHKAAAFVRFQELVHKDSVKLREASGSGMSVKEFLYPMLQAYDFLHLYENYGCRVQLGGNDQVGNIDTGIALIRRKTGQRVFGLTVPLLVAADGSKIGKTTSASLDDVIWLSAKKLRPFHLFQMLLNQKDSLMSMRTFQSLSFFSPDEIEQLLVDQKNNPQLRPAQRALAQDITLLVHGAGSLQACEMGSRILFPSRAIHQSNRSPMEMLSEGLSLSERNFLTACLAHYTAPVDGPLPVLHDMSIVSGTPVNPVDRLHQLLKVALSREQDRGNILAVETVGIVLNGLKILNGDSNAKRKNCNGSERTCLRKSLMNSEAAIVEAWRAADSVTGFSILQIGKRGVWFIVPFEKVRNFSM